MKKRKLLVGMLTTTLIMSTGLVGCSNDSKQTSSQSTTNDGAMTEAFTGYPIKTDETITYWGNLSIASTDYTSLNDTPFGKGLVKNTGVNVDFQHPPKGQEQEQFSLILADGNLPDVMEYPWMTYPGGPEKAISDGYIVPLNDIFEKYCPNLTAYLKENPEIDRMIKTDEGNYYVFPFIRGDKELCNTIGLMLRGDWLEELNMEVPTTIDEWHDVLVAFKEKKGATAPLSYEYTMGIIRDNNPFAYAFNATRNFYLGEDGSVKYGPIEENYKQYLTTFAQWYQEGLIDVDLATLAMDQVSAKITSGQAGASYGWAGSRMGVWTNAGLATDSDFSLVAAPVPTLEKGAYPEMGQLESQYSNQGCVAITTSCKNIELAARLLDYAYSEEGHMYYNFGTLGESYEMVGDYPTYTDLILNNPDGLPVAEILGTYVRGNYNGPFVQDKRYLEQYYVLDAQKEANGIWGETNAEKYKLPPITPTVDESKEFSTIMNEVNTYRDEMSLKFILGLESLDKFDEFTQTIKAMNIDRAIEIQNAALERYKAR